MRLGSPLPSIGEGLELQAVAAAVIGGTALAGGIGSIIGGIIGAVLIRVIDNGMVMSRVDSNWFKFAVGALTILAVVGGGCNFRTGAATRTPACINLRCHAVRVSNGRVQLAIG